VDEAGKIYVGTAEKYYRTREMDDKVVF